MLYSSRMQTVTEQNLLLAKQPQKLFTAFHVPLVVVADMINEATIQLLEQEKSFLDTTPPEAIERRFFSPSKKFFAARRHRFNNKVFMIRMYYKFAEDKNMKNKFFASVYSAEAMNEKEYTPVLPL